MAVLERDLSKGNVVKINNHDLEVKEFKEQRVITFEDIDRVHERIEGTAGKNFRNNKDRFIEGVDYFRISKDEVGENFSETYGFNIFAPSGILITESGYLMLVKSLTDDLAWKVQRELVNNYFRSKQLVNTLNELSPQLQLLIQMELKQSELEKEVIETKEQIAVVKETIINDAEDWRDWANKRIAAIGGVLGDYRRPRIESYEELERRARCNLDRRLENKLENMKLAGASKKTITNTNKLDVIDEDQRLREIYISIVKEMCIKYL